MTHYLKLLFDERGLRSKDIAEMLGVSETFLSKVVHGRERLSSERAEKLCEILELDDSNKSVFFLYTKYGTLTGCTETDQITRGTARI